MGIPFQPPQELINAYFNRKQPAEIANEGIQGALQTYVQQKALQQTQQLAQEDRDIKLAQLRGSGGQVAIDRMNALRTARGQQPITIPQSPSPSANVVGTTAAVAPPDAMTPEANYQPASGDPAIAVASDGSHIVNHWNSTMGSGIAPTGGPTPPTGKPTTPEMGSDPSVQEWVQMGDRAYTDKYGTDEAKRVKDIIGAEKNLQGKGPKPYYDSKGNKLFEIPANGAIIPGSESKDNKNYIGNSEAGYAVYADKDGNQFSQGQPYSGKILTKNSETPTGTERSTAAYAKTIIPHISILRQNIAEADKKGYIGPAAGRIYGDFLSGKVGSTGNPDADRLLGKLRAEDSLMKSGAMKVHFGSRGGQQMYEHFSGLLNTGKQSAAMLNGALDGLDEYMQGYASLGVHGGGGGGASPKSGDPLGIR